MSSDSSRPPARPAHALALDLLRRLGTHSGATVLEIGRGSGRNTAALTAAGHIVVGLNDPVSADAALSTHALLHGTRADVAALLEEIAERLRPGAPFYGTFGSTEDARFGEGTRIDDGCYAPSGGDEAGVAHAFFDEAALREMLQPRWEIDRLDHVRVDDVAGAWAHLERPLRDAYHWFARLRKPYGSALR
jgi:hypothetical protein